MSDRILVNSHPQNGLCASVLRRAGSLPNAGVTIAGTWPGSGCRSPLTRLLFLDSLVYPFPLTIPHDWSHPRGANDNKHVHERSINRKPNRKLSFRCNGNRQQRMPDKIDTYQHVPESVHLKTKVTSQSIKCRHE